MGLGNLALASMLADEVAILHAGHLMESGPVAQVFRTPTHAYTRALLAGRLDLDTPLQHRLPEIGPGYTVVTPRG